MIFLITGSKDPTFLFLVNCASYDERTQHNTQINWIQTTADHISILHKLIRLFVD